MPLRLRYVAGVNPAKWLRAWGERRADLPLEAARVEQHEQADGIATGDVDLAFVRLPIETEGLNVVPLWEETPVAVLPREHPLADRAALTVADLHGEPLAPVQPDAAMTVELVAAGTGYAVLPHGVARLHHRKDVVAIPLSDAPTTRIALVWRVERDDDDIQEFVAVVRGRTARSSRGATDEAPAANPKATRAAKRATAQRTTAQQAAAKRASRARSRRRGR
ncbi:LysR family transcriptional regulator substrate-binding protein [Agromyces sp. SYSU K20354]|uniref:LysR family transcriptional regulator substrate-binding protein n=1 Tax=Agromyces cavernae TaxID=2898659 RepID=UPI001E6447F0|nr:LysR family transcriptional regulator substrate-binding protein [Agromyces cavernae]MCD2441597.1 LysR family transcriptional regulator substrate-binding protein [Agromyces cavernae]